VTVSSRHTRHFSARWPFFFILASSCLVSPGQYIPRERMPPFANIACTTFDECRPVSCSWNLLGNMPGEHHPR